MSNNIKPIDWVLDRIDNDITETVNDYKKSNEPRLLGKIDGLATAYNIILENRTKF
jgi:hypothetical protein